MNQIVDLHLLLGAIWAEISCPLCQHLEDRGQLLLLLDSSLGGILSKSGRKVNKWREFDQTTPGQRSPWGDRAIPSVLNSSHLYLVVTPLWGFIHQSDRWRISCMSGQDGTDSYTQETNEPLVPSH